MKLIMVFYYSKADKYGNYQMVVKMVNTETRECAYYEIRSNSSTIDNWARNYLNYKQYYIEDRPPLSNIPIRQFNKEFGDCSYLDHRLKFKKALEELGVIK